MTVRFREDWRSLVWAFLLFPIAPVVGIVEPTLALALLPLSLYSAYAAGVLTHNHNHVRVFENRVTNAVYSGWLSIFYGLPIFVWIPTHNQNHHRYLDGEGDATRTIFVGNTVASALLYSMRAGAWQAPHVGRYLRRLYRRSPLRLAEPFLQVFMLVAAHGAALRVATALHPGLSGVVAYASTLGVPALLAPALLQLTNYLQHVDCDPKSPDGHSRNFVSPLFNWFLFQNGYHTVHHENPGTHWSRYRALHEARAARIDPHLNQRTPFEYVLERYTAHRIGLSRPGSPCSD